MEAPELAAERSRLECGSVLSWSGAAGSSSVPVTHSFLLSLSGLFCVNMYTALSLQTMSGARPLHPNSLGSIPRLWSQILYRTKDGTLMWLNLAPGAAPECPQSLCSQISQTYWELLLGECRGPLTLCLFTNNHPEREKAKIATGVQGPSITLSMLTFYLMEDSRTQEQTVVKEKVIFKETNNNKGQALQRRTKCSFFLTKCQMRFTIAYPPPLITRPVQFVHHTQLSFVCIGVPYLSDCLSGWRIETEDSKVRSSDGRCLQENSIFQTRDRLMRM